MWNKKWKNYNGEAGSIYSRILPKCLELSVNNIVAPFDRNPPPFTKRSVILAPKLELYDISGENYDELAAENDAVHTNSISTSSGASEVVSLDTTQTFNPKSLRKRFIERKRGQRIDKKDKRKFDYMTTTNLTEKFSYIYKTQLWSAEGKGSGPGSSMVQTVEIREQLPIIVKKYNLHSMLDCPCGAMNWMPFVLKEIEKFRSNFIYTGIDIVPEVITQIKREFLQHSNWDFAVGDMTSGDFEIKPYDLILSRDVFFHLPYDKIKCAVNTFSNSK